MSIDATREVLQNLNDDQISRVHARIAALRVRDMIEADRQIKLARYLAVDYYENYSAEDLAHHVHANGLHDDLERMFNEMLEDGYNGRDAIFPTNDDVGDEV